MPALQDTGSFSGAPNTSGTAGLGLTPQQTANLSPEMLQLLQQLSGGSSQSPFMGAYNALATSAGPEMAGLQAQGANAALQLPLQQGLTQSQMGEQSALAGFGLQRIGVERGQLGIQQGAVARELGLLPKEFGLQQQSLGLSEAQAKRQEAFQQKGFEGSRAAAGAYTAAGTGRGIKEMQADLATQLAQYGIQGKEEKLQFQDQMAQLRDQQKNLGLMAQTLGIDAKELTTKLNYTLAQLGLQGAITANQLVGMVYSSDTQQAALAQQLIQQSLAIAPTTTGGATNQKAL